MNETKTAKATAAAALANRRKRQNRLADELRAAGWVCVPPEQVIR